MKSEDFFRVLQERQIRRNAAEHANLREFLQVSDENPQLLLVSNIQQTLQMMAENEQFMSAIHDDLMPYDEAEELQDRGIEDPNAEEVLRKID